MVVSRQHTQISGLTRFNFIHFYLNSLFFLLQPGVSGVSAAATAHDSSNELVGMRCENWGRLKALREAGTVIKAGSN